YYNAVSQIAQTSPTSPFNGTTGMGFGTFADLPPTCTPTPPPIPSPGEAGGGVGYFATDQGPQGTLYQCSATDTWTVHYVPYTYPPPLVSGTPPPPPPPPPPPLSTFTISVSASPSRGGTVSGGGSFSNGSPDTVTATANNGYTFVNWTV